MSELGYEIVERIVTFKHRRARIECSVNTAEFFAKLAQCTGLTLEDVMERSAFLFAEHARVGEALCEWAEAIAPKRLPVVLA